IMVWLPDRPDLFASICQYLDRQGLDIQDARLHTTRHGYALDSFVVISHQAEAVYQDMIGRTQRELAAKLELPYRRHPAEAKGGSVRLARQPRQARVFPIVPRVTLQPLSAPAQWRLSIVAVDRPGLLHTLANVFSAHQADLKMAKIHTLGERVDDTFVIENQRLTHAPYRLAFERALIEALGPSPSTP